MKSRFVSQFLRKVAKGLLLGSGIILLLFALVVMRDENQPSWIVVASCAVLCLMFGIGWVFVQDMTNRRFKKMLHISGNVTFGQVIEKKGLLVAVLCRLLCFLGGCVFGIFVGNFLLWRDAFCLIRGRAPMSEKYKFDSDLEYNDWLSSIRKDAAK